jgi:hypothetical protein
MNGVLVLGLNNEELNDPSFALRFDLGRMAFAELAAERLRKRDRWAAHRVASQSRSGFVVYGRGHCLQREFTTAMPGCVTVFANDWDILALSSVRAIIRDRGDHEAVFLQLDRRVLAAYVPGWIYDQ